MKKIIVLLFLVIAVITAYSQTTDDLQKIKNRADQDTTAGKGGNRPKSIADWRRQRANDKANDEIFGADDPAFRTTAIPDKWAGESAVILAQKHEYDYESFGLFNEGILKVTYIERQRIKLLDKIAVERYSQFYFPSNSAVGYKVIKADGRVIDVDLHDAVNLTKADPVPVYYNLYGFNVKVGEISYAVDWMKIAIPDLQPGDIIDHFTKYTWKYERNINLHHMAFNPVFFNLPQNYPVVNQSVDFKVEKGFYINFASSNGAPQLREKPSDDSHARLFSLVDTNRKRDRNEKWEYQYRSVPSVKFQVVYTSESKKGRIPYFLGDPLEPMSNIPTDLLRNVANMITMDETHASKSYVDAIMAYMKDKHKDVTDPVKYMSYAYYFFRYYYLMDPGRFDDADRFKGQDEDHFNESGRINERLFVKTLSALCRINKFDYDVLFVEPNNLGTMDNMVLSDELRWVVRVKASPDLYLYPCDRFRNVNEMPGDMDGADAFVLKPDEDDDKATVTQVKMPSAKSTDNVNDLHIDVTFDEDMETATLARTYNYSGIYKGGFYPRILILDQYLDQEEARYGDQTSAQYIKSIKNDDKRAEEQRKYDASVEEEKRKRLKWLEKGLEKKDILDFQLICDGRQMDSTTLSYKDKIKVKDLLSQAGPNYLLDFGKLVTRQLELEEKDTSARLNDIYMNGARQSNDEIVIHIPDGYTADGVDALNTNVANDVGGFTTSAKLQGNTLVIKTCKFFNHGYEPAANWPKIMAFMKSDQAFTEKKILLKKV